MAEPLISLLLERITMVLSQQVLEEVNLVGGVEKQADKLKSNLIDGAMQFLQGKQGMLKNIFTTNRRYDVPSWDILAFVSIKWFSVVTLPLRSKKLVKNWMRLPMKELGMASKLIEPLMKYNDQQVPIFLMNQA
ncbi:hypothetical protein OIU79_029297 [Salix purpurea]|uniref:Uncharacterized protein n=1 Tax=Salix purpurea TaxID=77065 RepID=A0A9Q0ZV67_SALPP|nr:hypothetical protein OIU79_029297 [Salix purpurea]